MSQPPQPWDLDAFPALCPHCGATLWYRPAEKIGNSECWNAIYAERKVRGPDFDDKATAWWKDLDRTKAKSSAIGVIR